jgi:hypothetical protein
MPKALAVLMEGPLVDRLAEGAVNAAADSPRPDPQGSNVYSACCPPPSTQCHTVGCR